MTGLARLVPAFVLAFVFDWFTKQWAEQSLVLYQPVPVVGQWIQLTLGYNSGVAFGLFAHGGVWLALASGAVLAGTVVWLLTPSAQEAHTRRWLGLWACCLAAGSPICSIGSPMAGSRISSTLD